MEFLKDYLPQILTLAVTLLSAIVGFLVVYFNSKKAKYEYQEKLADKEKQNLELQQAIITGSYIICPNCGQKIYLKDSKVYTQEVEKNE